MNGYLYIDDLKVGEANFQVIDQSMGAIGGQLTPNSTYEVYRTKIQELCEKKGIANIEDFKFKIILDNEITIHPEGGIGVTNITEFEEIYVESVGISSNVIAMVNQLK